MGAVEEKRVRQKAGYRTPLTSPPLRVGPPRTRSCLRLPGLLERCPVNIGYAGVVVILRVDERTPITPESFVTSHWALGGDEPHIGAYRTQRYLNRCHGWLLWR